MPRRIAFCLLVLLLFWAAAPRLASCAGISLSSNEYDMAFKEGWNLLLRESFAEAREAFAGIPPEEHDLGDYVLFFSGMAAARDRKRLDATALMKRLEVQYRGSPLIPYMKHEIGYAAALDNDIVLLKAVLPGSKGKVTGDGRKAEELYMSALLVEGEGAAADALQLHLENFASYTAQSAANLSYERLWDCWKDGKLKSLGLPVSFYARLGKTIGRTVDIDRARDVYDDALNRFSPSPEYFSLALAYAELLRKHGKVSEAAALLEKRFEGGLAVHRNEMRFLQARVDWKAGRLAEARNGFMSVASEATQAIAERARYSAAWVALEQGDVAWATEVFGRLRQASDDRFRSESVFRHAYGLYLQKKHDEAISVFQAGERSDAGGVEAARHRFWRARALRESGRTVEAAKLLADVAADPEAGIYVLFALRDQGGDPFVMFNAASSGETATCLEDRVLLWDKVLGASWNPADREKVRRAARLISLGVVNYAALEAQRVDRASVEKAIGLDGEGAAGLFRYLAGDLRGGVRETRNLTMNPENPGLIGRIRYPLAPEYVGDCDQPQAGIDPLVLHSIIRQESLFQPDAVSPAGAVGLMQLMPKTAALVAKRRGLSKPTRTDLTRPEINVYLGTHYLAGLLKEFDGDYFRAVSAYNSGETPVRKWWDASGGNDPAAYLEQISYQETRLYLRRVVFNLLQYYRIYRPDMFALYLSTFPATEPITSCSEATLSRGDSACVDPATRLAPGAAPSKETQPQGRGEI